MKRNDKGTPQGGVISPLLANLYLHWFEKVLLRKIDRGQLHAGIVRYPRKAFREINRYTRERMTKHLKRRSQRAYQVPAGKSYYEHLEDLGLIYL